MFDKPEEIMRKTHIATCTTYQAHITYTSAATTSNTYHTWRRGFWWLCVCVVWGIFRKAACGDHEFVYFSALLSGFAELCRLNKIIHFSRLLVCHRVVEHHYYASMYIEIQQIHCGSIPPESPFSAESAKREMRKRLSLYGCRFPYHDSLLHCAAQLIQTMCIAEWIMMRIIHKYLHMRFKSSWRHVSRWYRIAHFGPTRWFRVLSIPQLAPQWQSDVNWPGIGAKLYNLCIYEYRSIPIHFYLKRRASNFYGTSIERIEIARTQLIINREEADDGKRIYEYIRILYKFVVERFFEH